MYLLEDLKFNKLYKKQFIIPFNKENKRKGAAILLLTPNRESSRQLMRNPFMLDRMHLFSAYYVERDIMYTINHESGLLETIHYEYDDNGVILESATPFIETTDVFMHCSDYDTLEMAEAYCRLGDRVIFFNEMYDDYYFDEAANDMNAPASDKQQNGLSAKYKRLLYNDRLRNIKSVVQLYDAIKADEPWIKRTFPSLERYKGFNLFIDLYYYNQAYLTNNTFTIVRSIDMYFEFIRRFILDRRLDDAGYTKRTIFIPITGWPTIPGTAIYDYKKNLNPISVLYKKIRFSQSDLNVFKGLTFVLFGQKGYIKFTPDVIPIGYYNKFKRFLDILINGEEFEDDEDDNSPNGIATDLIQDIEQASGAKIDNLTGNTRTSKIIDVEIGKTGKTMTIVEDKDNKQPPKIIQPRTTRGAAKKIEDTIGSTTPAAVKPAPLKSRLAIDKKKAEVEVSSNNQPDMAEKDETDAKEVDKAILVKKINQVSQVARTKDEAIDMLEADKDAKRIIADLEDERGGTIRISATRANRITRVQDSFLDSKLNGRSIRQMLEQSNKPTELPDFNVPIETINQEWHHVKAPMFERTYDLDADIMRCLYSLSDKTTKTYPIAILDVDKEDTSTSEDSVYTYTVKCEGYDGKRFTLKFDIPKFRDNRFMRLRGNEKIFQIEMPLLPISKTSDSRTQIATFYNKLFIDRYNTAAGKSNPFTDKLMKALNKYNGKGVKTVLGDNTRICKRYDLPIDYIDLASVYNKIIYHSKALNEEVTIYFNQDEIRKIPGVNAKNGIPIAMTKSGKVMYYGKMATIPLSQFVANLIDDEGFQKVYATQTGVRRTTYGLVKILNTYIPVIVILAHDLGLIPAMDLAKVKYSIDNKRAIGDNVDSIPLKDGFINYQITYDAMMLMNGLKDCNTETIAITDLNKKTTWIEQLNLFGGRQKSDGLDNFRELMYDPITVEVSKHYGLPTTYHEALIYGCNLLVDNKYIKHVDLSGNRYRTNEIVAAQFYRVLSAEYRNYSMSAKRGRHVALSLKQSAVIDLILAQNNTSDLSVFQPLLEIETKNGISTKGVSGLNSERSYTLEKRGYDKSMQNILCQSTSFSGQVGVNRQTTIDPGITGGRGYFKQSEITKNSTVTNSMGMTEALSPFMLSSDDPFRNNMTFTQTAKHLDSTMKGLPLLVTTGADQAMPFLCSDMFAFKSKKSGVVTEINDEYMLVTYNDKTTDYITLAEQTMKNSDGGFFISLQLTTDFKVGQRFKANEVLAWDKYSFNKKVGLQQLAFNMGLLTKIAICSAEDGYEDSGVCSEYLSHAMGYNIVYQKAINLKPSAQILDILKVGTPVTEGQPILVFQDAYDEEDANVLLKNLNIEDGDISVIGRSIVKSKANGVICDIKMYRTCDMEELSESLQKLFKEYEAKIKSLMKKAHGSNTQVQFKPNAKLAQEGKLKSVDGVLIEIYVRNLDELSVGETAFAA